MARPIKLKRSATQGKVPAVGDLELGEVGLNTYDGKVFIKKDDGAVTIVEIGGGYNYEAISGNYTALVNDYLKCNTTNNTITVTLPASPTQNGRIGFIDIKGTFGTNNLTIDRNGNLIMDKAESLVASDDNMSFELIFSDGDWRII